MHARVWGGRRAHSHPPLSPLTPSTNPSPLSAPPLSPPPHPMDGLHSWQHSIHPLEGLGKQRGKESLIHTHAHHTTPHHTTPHHTTPHHTTHTHTRMHVHTTHACTHTQHMHARTHTHTHTYTHHTTPHHTTPHTHTHTRMHVHTTHACTHTHAHTHTYTHHTTCPPQLTSSSEQCGFCSATTTTRSSWYTVTANRATLHHRGKGKP